MQEGTTIVAFCPRPRRFFSFGMTNVELNWNAYRADFGRKGRHLTAPAEPKLAKASLHLLSTGCAVLEVVGRPVAADDLVAGLVAKDLDEHRHGEAADDTEAQDADHGQVAPAVPVGAGSRVLGPAGVQSVGRGYAAQIPEPRNESGCGCDADLAVAALEDLVGPGHADRHGGAEAETNHEKAAVASPGVLQGESHGQEPGDLDEDRAREEDGAQAVEAVRDGRDDQDGEKVHDPDGRE